MTVSMGERSVVMSTMMMMVFTYLSYLWKRAMPKTTTTQQTTETTTMPTMMVIWPPLTAERTCPPMMPSMVAYPTMRTMLRRQGILDGQ